MNAFAFDFAPSSSIRLCLGELGGDWMQDMSAAQAFHAG